MKSSLEKTSGLGRKLHFEIPADKVTSAFDKVYKGLQRNANIKGFRKGKAPINVIKKMYSDSVKQDVLESIFSEAYTAALTEHTLRPVSEPMLNFDDLSENSDFKFSAEFEIRPEISLKRIEKLKVETEKLEIKEEEIEKILSQILESRAIQVPVFEDRPLQNGDVAEIDFKGTIEGKPLEGGSMDGHKLTIGSNAFIPGFEDGLIGMKIGAQRILNLKFPENYGHKEIASKPVEFDVTLKNILKNQLPELTDDFVKTLGGYNSVDELKSLIRQDVTEQESQRIREDLKNRILRALVNENPVDVPISLKDKQKDLLIADVEKRMKEQGMSDADLEEYKRKWDSDFSTTADFMIQSSFLIESIAEKNQLYASDSEVVERLIKYSKQAQIDLKSIQDFYQKNPDRRHQVQYQITEEKVVDYLIKNADLIEVAKDKLTKVD